MSIDTYFTHAPLPAPSADKQWPYVFTFAMDGVNRATEDFIRVIVDEINDLDSSVSSLSSSLSAHTADTTNPHSVNAADVPFTVMSVSATTWLVDAAVVVLVDSASGAVTVRLPYAAGCVGQTVIVKKSSSDTNVVSVKPRLVEYIDHYAVGTGPTMTAQDDSLTLVSLGAPTSYGGNATWAIVK